MDKTSWTPRLGPTIYLILDGINYKQHKACAKENYKIQNL